MKSSALVMPIAFALSLLVPRPVASAPRLSGLWDATVVTANNVEIPFRFEIVQHGGQVQGFFFEGDRKVGSTSGSFQNGTLIVNYDFLNTTLEATPAGGELRGTYRSHRPNAQPLAFRARRFVPVPADPADAPQVAGSWAMYRTAADNSKLDVSWRLYLRQSGAEVSGAILKTSGDSGMLMGRWHGDQLVMSHFAGERPLLFEARLNADGTLAITLDRRFTYRAAHTTEARTKGIPEPPDPSRFTSVKDPTEPFHFSGPDVAGHTVSDADVRFQGQVVVVTIGGSWCPNCLDEAPLLVEFYREFHPRGLEIVGLFFEVDRDLALARPRVESFIRRFRVPFPVLVPGIPDDAAQKLPQLVNFAVYPTTLFIGRDGRVRSVNAGFASAATGDEHLRLKRDMRALIERLLAEQPSSADDTRKFE
jgi:thiol-disulfide isomerase/thioredoxin